MPARVLAAAKRSREILLRAKKVGYYHDAWYSYMYKIDVETLIEHVIGPYPEGQEGDRL